MPVHPARTTPALTGKCHGRQIDFATPPRHPQRTDSAAQPAELGRSALTYQSALVYARSKHDSQDFESLASTAGNFPLDTAVESGINFGRLNPGHAHRVTPYVET
jgi:hypothetical protein